MIAFQAFFNISVVLGLLPTKGIPLPFVSAGGSSLLINMIGMAVLLNVSQHASPGSGRRRVHVATRCMRPLRILIAGGGTGGHLFPGIAVAREMLRQRPDAVVTFAGTARGIESRVVPREGFALDVLRSAGLKATSLQARVARPVAPAAERVWMPGGSSRARRPDVVIGVGGYSSGPVVLAAAARRHPDAAAGAERGAWTHQPAARARGQRRGGDVRVDRRASSEGRGFVTGNPVRPEFFDVAPERVDGPPRLLIFGGSQGAHAINVAMVEAAPGLAARSLGLDITHQTGERDLDLVKDGYRRAGRRGARRAVPLRHGPRDEARRPRRLPLGRDDDRGADGIVAAGDLHPAADRGGRSPARQRGGARRRPARRR